MNQINWCKVLDGIGWAFDERDNTIWGHDTSMSANEINDELSRRINQEFLKLLDEMKNDFDKYYRCGADRDVIEKRIQKFRDNLGGN